MSRPLRLTVRILLGLLGVVIVAVAALHFAVSTEAVQRYLRTRLEAVLSRELDRRVRIGKLTVSPLLNFLELRQVTVSGRDETRLAEVGHVRFYPDLSGLLRRGFAFRTVVLLRPVIDLSPARESDERIGTARPPASVRAPLEVFQAVPVDRVQVREGQVTLRSGGRLWYGRGVEADIWRVESEIRSALRVAEGVLDLPGRPLIWRDLQGRVTLAENDLVIPRLEADLGGGSVSLHGRIRTVFGAPDLELDVTGTIPLSSWFAVPGIVRVGGRLTGPGGTPRFEGTAHFEGGVWPDFRFRLVTDREGMRGEDLVFLAMASEVSGGFRLRWSDFRYAAEIRGRGVALDRLLIPGLGPLPMSGTLALDAAAEGRGINPADLAGQASFEIRGLGRRGGAEPTGRAEGSVKAERGRVLLERLHVEILPNRLSMKGSVWEKVDLEVGGKFPRMDLVGQVLGLGDMDGKGEVTGRVRGSLLRPVFQGRLIWETPRVLGVELAEVRGEILIHDRTLSAPRLTLTKGKTTGVFNLRLAVPIQTEPLDLTRDLRLQAQGQVNGSLAEFLSLFVRHPLPVQGRLKLDARLEGVPGRLEGQGRFAVKDAIVFGESWPVAEGDMKLAAGHLLLENVRLARGTEQVTGSGQVRFGDLETRFRVTAARFPLERFRLFAGTGLDGVLRVEAQGEGRVDNPKIQGTVELAALRYETLSLGGGRGRFQIAEKLMSAEFTLPESGYSATAHLQITPPYTVDGRMTLKQAELGPLLGLSGVGLLKGSTGSGTGTAQLGGELGSPPRLSRLALELEVPALRVQGHTYHTTQPFKVDLQGEVLTIAPVALSGKAGWLHGGGRIAFDGAVDLKVQGKVPLALILHRPGAIGNPTGTGTVDLTISGPWRAPRYTGELTLAAGGFRVADHPEAFQQIGGQVDFRGGEIHIGGLTGQWAGGKMQAVGSAVRTSGTGWRWAIDLGLEDADAGRVFARAGKGKGTVTGRTYIVGKVTAEGSRWSALEQSRAGKLTLRMQQGRVRGLTVLANILRIVNLTPDPVEGVPYDSLRASFDLKRDVLETRDLRFVSDTMKVGGVGTIDVGRREVDMLLGVQPLRTLDKVINFLQLSKIPVLGRLLFGKERSVLVIAVKVAGSWDQPAVVAVPEESLGRGLFGIFRRLLELPGEVSSPEKSGPTTDSPRGVDHRDDF